MFYLRMLVMNVAERMKLLVEIGLDLGLHQVSSLLSVIQQTLFC